VKLNYWYLLFLLLNFSVFAQPLTVTEHTRVSILTIGPGDNLYDKFGHSAFRIADETTELDVVFNYGVYDFDTPNFYLKFAQGKLLYKLAVSDYDSFLAGYIAQKRWVSEQLLDLEYAEVNALFQYLLDNAKPENKYYKYDFFYDNCATRIRDVLVSVLGKKLSYQDNLATEGATFRDLIQKNVYWNSWGSMGMDVAIGAVVDRQATSWQYQFLPEYVAKAAADATLSKNGATRPLVKETHAIFEVGERNEMGNFWLSPLFFFAILGFLLILVTVMDYKANRRSRFLDSSIFAISGILGILLSLLWFATDHSATAYNYNLLWAFPFSVLFFLKIGKRNPKQWLSRYLVFLVLLLVLMAFHWITGIQVFPLSMLPLFIGLMVRYLYLQSFLKKIPNTPIDPGKI
jgi:hypothetical protein